MNIPDIQEKTSDALVALWRLCEGGTRFIRIDIGSTVVTVPVSSELYAYWNEQFVRLRPTQLQRKRYRTLMNILRMAYLKGHKDGRRGSLG